MFFKDTQPSDRISERNACLVVAALILSSFVVNALSRIADEAAMQVYREPAFAWIDEGSSAFVLLILLPWVGIFNRLTPVVGAPRKEWIPKYFLASVVFSLIHVIGMFAIRFALYPVFSLYDYTPPAEALFVFFYEYRKDVITYAIFVLAFAVSRELEYKKLEADVASQDAKEKNRITLKSGGRIIYIDSAQILWAKAAGNYVEVYTTTGGMHLARSTLSGLRSLLEETSNSFIRTHRSYLVNQSAVHLIESTGEGDAQITLSLGDKIPASRRYRQNWLPA